MNFRSVTTLQWAIGASIAVHAVLLTVRFVDPEAFNRVFEDTPLEVILVNAKSNEKPDKAQVIAQNALAGGGDADKGRATSPLPPSALTDIGDSLEEESARKLQSLQEQQNLLLAQVKNQLAALPPPDPSKLADKAEAEARAKAPEVAPVIKAVEAPQPKPATPIVAAPTAATGISSTRPTGVQIVEVLALHYRVHESKVIEWLISMDFEDIKRDLESEFA